MNDKADFTQGTILKKIRFYIRAFSGFYGKSGIESCNFCSDTVCNGYYGTDCEISR